MRTFKAYLSEITIAKKDGETLILNEENLIKINNIFIDNINKTYFIGNPTTQGNRESISILSSIHDSTNKLIQIECGAGKEGTHTAARAENDGEIDISDRSAETDHFITFIFEASENSTKFITVVETEGLTNPLSRIDWFIKNRSKESGFTRKLYPRFTPITDTSHFREMINFNESLEIELTAETESARGNIIREKKIYKLKIENNKDVKSELIDIIGNARNHQRSPMKKIIDKFATDSTINYDKVVITGKNPAAKNKNQKFKIEDDILGVFSYPIETDSHSNDADWINRIHQKASNLALLCELELSWGTAEDICKSLNILRTEFNVSCETRFLEDSQTISAADSTGSQSAA